MTINVTAVLHHFEEAVTIAAVLANFLPKSEVFDDYPGVKKFYETFVIKLIAGTAQNWRNRLPSLDLSIPGYGLTKPPGALPSASVEEIRAGESKPGPVHPPEEAPKV